MLTSLFRQSGVRSVSTVTSMGSLRLLKRPATRLRIPPPHQFGAATAAAGLHHVSSRRAGINIDEARKDLTHHREEAYAKAQAFADHARALRESMQRQLPTASMGHQKLGYDLIDIFARSSLELQDRVQQHARHVDEEVAMFNAQISDDIVQEADDIRLADRRLDEMIAKANHILEEDTRRLQHRLQKMTSGAGLLVDDVELGRQSWHLHSLEDSAAKDKSQTAMGSESQTGHPVQESLQNAGNRFRQAVTDNVSQPTQQYARGMYDDVADAVENITHKAGKAKSAAHEVSGKAKSVAHEASSTAKDMGEKLRNTGEMAATFVDEEAGLMGGKLKGDMESVVGAVEEAASTTRQRVSEAYETATDVLGGSSAAAERGAHVFEEKMGSAYDMLKDGMDMTGLAEAKETAKEAVQSGKQKVKQAGETIRQAAAEATTTSADSTAAWQAASSKDQTFDAEALNALLDEMEDSGVVINEKPEEMLRRKSEQQRA